MRLLHSRWAYYGLKHEHGAPLREEQPKAIDVLYKFYLHSRCGLTIIKQTNQDKCISGGNYMTLSSNMK